MGGQTALNTALALHKDGTLDRLGVEMIGARPAAIEKAEDRLAFREAMDRIGLDSPLSFMARSMDDAQAALDHVGLPAIIRPSYTLGGTGGGIAYNRDEYSAQVEAGLAASPTSEVLVEESVLGWKEFEMEVVRDQADNCIIICSIENIDPMGIHTGDSVTVAPALTLTDKEYQIMRNASIAVLREIGVDTGGSNVQFAVDPETGRLIIIEMNPRVSRSSALASKATGFPIAKIAAKLAVGYTLDELDNDITGVTPASFEPTIDYVVTKIPRFTFEKFPGTDALLTTSMKAVGEVMAIGPTFAASLQKALRSMETGLTGLNEVHIPGAQTVPIETDALRAALGAPTPDRILTIAQAMRHGLGNDDIHAATKFDPWFLDRIREIVEVEAGLRRAGLPKNRDSDATTLGLADIKAMGFSDVRIAELTGVNETDVADARVALDLYPTYRRIDTCAGEFPSRTPYMYSTYGQSFTANACESNPTEAEKIIILGGGPNRIGQGIEFDYCCCHAVFALTEAGYETIMVNCNPETVSTDYDTADRLYFEPLTGEDVIEIARIEAAKGTLKGVIVQLGGQTPLKLSHLLEKAGIPILGTTPDAIDLAEDRERFQKFVRDLGLRQPNNGTAKSGAQAARIAAEIGYPVLLRPSYVLGGRAMEIVHDEAALNRYVTEAVQVSGDSPVLVDSYLSNAIEVDVDALCDKDGAVYVAGIMEHIEEAGIHSGDSACSLPPYSLPEEIIAKIRQQTKQLAQGLNVVGLMNVQFAVKEDELYLIEVNPRASRTVPFVAKATGVPIAKIGARLMAGETLADFDLDGSGDGPNEIRHVAVKEAVFPFDRFPGVDPVLGPEMKSTGEVMGLDTDFGRAFAKSQIGGGQKVPTEGMVFISVRDTDKPTTVDLATRLIALGFSITATRGTAAYLADRNIEVTQVNKVLEGRPHIVDLMKNGDIQLVFNTTSGVHALSDSFSLRRTALTENIPYYTTISGARASVAAIKAVADGVPSGGLEVAPLQSYFSNSY